MKCDLCAKKKATVHLTEIVDGQMTEMHICEECAKEKSVQMEQQFGLADLLAGLADFNKPTKEAPKIKMTCMNCGMDYDEFKKLGRLGCSECYSSFESNLSGLLKKIHGSAAHSGKAPNRVPEKDAPTVKTNVEVKRGVLSVADLRVQLQQLIQQEDYEGAAKLRDKIRELEKKGK